MDGPVEEAAQPQHAPAQEQGAGQPVVMDVLQEDQDHSVPPLLHPPVPSIVGLESVRHGREPIVKDWGHMLTNRSKIFGSFLGFQMEPLNSMFHLWSPCLHNISPLVILIITTCMKHI